jgi:hypothetical protein
MRLLTAVPVFNEERYIDAVLSEIVRYAWDVLIIDDGSTDETPACSGITPTGSRSSGTTRIAAMVRHFSRPSSRPSSKATTA